MHQKAPTYVKRSHFLKPCPICGTSRTSYERILNNIELLKCSACDFVYANLKDKEIIEANSTFAEGAIARYREQQTIVDNVWFKMIVKRLTKMVGSGKALDVGCGNGVLLKHFVDQKWSAYGVDVSPWAKTFARIYNYTLYSSELEKSGLPSNYFDVVTSTSTLEHVAQPYQHVREIVRVLRPGGIAYFSGIPHYGSLSVRVKLSKFHMPPRNVNYFTDRTMYRLFSNPDIAENIKKLSITSYGIPESYRMYNLLRKFMQKIISKSKTQVDGLAAPGFLPELTQDSRLLPLGAFAMILITINYRLGKLFHLGDKLEVMAIKRG
jgi:ubiquinone/menaquinone biosynthesis C-methylase UbiE